MIAFVSYAGGHAEYRLHRDHEENGEVRVEHWCHHSEHAEMVLDDSCKPEYYKDVFRAMIAIATALDK